MPTIDNSFIITDGRFSYEVVYDATTQANYKALLGASSTGGEPRVITHTPDTGEQTPAHLTELDKTFTVTMDVTGNDWDDVINRIASIKRLVDGADSQAARFYTHGDVARVVLRVQLAGSTNYTDWPIKWGAVDDSDAFYTDASQATKRARFVTIRLRTAPHGQGAAITLNNELKNSNFTLFNAGVALGWNNLSGATLAQDTSNYLIADSSQKITPVGANDGINSDTVTNTSDTAAAAYAWIQPNNNSSISVQLYDVTGAAALATTTITSASSYSGAARSLTGPDGNTWYKVEVKDDAFTSGNDVQLRIFSSDIGTAFYVDAAYLELGTGTVPEAGWISGDAGDSGGYALDNRNDAYNNDENRINYLEFWDIPGDSDALISYDFTFNGGAGVDYNVITSAVSDGLVSAAKHQFVIEGEDLTKSSGTGTFANASPGTPANFHGGDYKIYTNTSGGAQSLVVYNDITKDKVPYGMYRVFIACRTDDATVPETISITNFLGGDYQSEAVGLAASGGFELLDLGYIAVSDFIKIQVLTGNGAATSARLEITVAGVANGTAFDIDAIFLLPTHRAFMIVQDQPYAATDIVYSVSVDRWPQVDVWQSSNTDSGRVPVGGKKAATIASGAKATRLYFLGHRATGAFTPTETINIRNVNIIPRVRHLLGTT